MQSRERFKAQVQRLVDQYNSYEVLPGISINGELTVGENIGDLGGADIALQAYELSLDGKTPPVIDGLSGRERFFLGLAQVFRMKFRDDELRSRVKNDPHSPAMFRVNGVVRNMDAFYDTFDVNAGDDHYLPAGERVRIWN